MKEDLFLAAEIIGIIAFSVSGAAVAYKKQMDLFGIIILGACTALGGGVIRDVLLGITPPTMFRNPLYAIVAAVAALVVFIPAVQKLLEGSRAYDNIMLVMDSIGLGLFTVLGIQTALEKDSSYNFFVLVAVGVITGIGGGILRDVLAGERPYVFVKHFYACASIIGAIICVVLKNYISLSAASVIAAAVIVALRILAAFFRWKLPKPKHYA